MKKLSLPVIGLFQALGLVTYVTVVATVMSNASHWVGPVDNKFFAPIAFLSMLVVSALSCALISLAYPIILIWDKKQTANAFKIIGFTIAWLIVFIILIFTGLSLSK